jgi:hypothetical protein
MGHGRHWTPDEREKLARAYRKVTGNARVGSDQLASMYRDKILAEFKTLSPPNAKDQDRYWARGAEAVWTYWRDTVSKDLNKFNKALMVIKAQTPTGGLSEQELINAAVAVHKRVTRKYTPGYRNYDPYLWANYGA